MKKPAKIVKWFNWKRAKCQPTKTHVQPPPDHTDADWPVALADQQGGGVC